MLTPYGQPGNRGALAPAAVILSSVAVLSVAVASGQAVRVTAAAVIVVSLVTAFSRSLSRWPTLVGAITLIILFVPIKRYKFAGVSLPFDLEPYRVAVFAVVLLWLSSVMIDPRISLRRSGLEKPILLFLFAVLASIMMNLQGIVRLDVSSEVAKELLFLASFVLVFYFVVSVVRTPAAIHNVLKTFVTGTAAVALFAIVERRTNYNVFNHLQSVAPVLDFRGELGVEGISRGGRLRTYASAQHPIALAGLFVIVVPLSFYLFQLTRRWRWALTSVLIVFGALATVSRTSITMMAAVGAVFLWLRPAAVKRLAPLILPALVVVHLALPGVIGSIRQAFFPPQGLIENQTKFGGRASARRLNPQFEIIRQQPAFGQGYGTRQTTGPKRNARVLDNQWLGIAVETGLVGFFAWAWIFARFIRRTGKEAKLDDSMRGWLLTAFAASAAAFAIGMATYDSFSFIQVAFVLYIVLALGSSTVAWTDGWPTEERARPLALSLRTPTTH